MRARYYNIGIMRFINQDILTGSIDSSQSLNRYAYVEGNPVNFLDPFGLCSDKVDTSTAHKIAAGLGIIALAAGIFATSATMAICALIAGVAISGFDTGLYINDAIEADTKEERNSALANGALSAATMGSGVLAQSGKVIRTIKGTEMIVSVSDSSKAKDILDIILNIISSASFFE